MVRNRARKTRNRELAVEVSTGEGRRSDGKIGDNGDGENVETATHGDPPWGRYVTTYNVNIVRHREWAVFAMSGHGKN